MKQALTVAIALFALSAIAQSTGTATAPPLLPSLSGISVANVEASAKWYSETLGFAIVKAPYDAAPGVRVALLQAGDYQLELVELAGSQATPADAKFRGLLKIGFRVPDVDELAAKLRARGVHIVAGPYTDQPYGVRALIAEDPDGTALQFVHPLTAPAPRNQTAVVLDEARSELVLFGGGDGGGKLFYADTWLRRDGAWKRSPVAGPSARGCHAMAYDSRRGRVVLFGGENATEAFGDTWEWDGRRWVKVASTGPPARSCHQMTFDRERNVVVLFGGWDGPVTRRVLHDTWEWNGSEWRRVAVAGPQGRLQFAFAYDDAQHASVLVGGMANVTEGAVRSLDDVWLWDGRSWARSKVPGPPPRSHHALAYDPARKRLVLFGGWNGGFLGDTLEWDGRGWMPMQPADPKPSARGGKPAMIYDAAHHAILLYGGWDKSGARGDIWSWDGQRWRLLEDDNALKPH